MEVKVVSPTIGKGVFAKKAFAEGEVVFSELPLLSAQLVLSKVRPLSFSVLFVLNSCSSRSDSSFCVEAIR